MLQFRQAEYCSSSLGLVPRQTAPAFSPKAFGPLSDVDTQTENTPPAVTSRFPWTRCAPEDVPVVFLHQDRSPANLRLFVALQQPDLRYPSLRQPGSFSRDIAQAFPYRPETRRSWV